MRRTPTMARILPSSLLAVLLVACGGDAPEPAPADVQAAAVLPILDAALFDSIAWPDVRDALDRGTTVYAYSCAKCHGDRGAGDGGYRLQGRLLRPPSFLTVDWQYANDVDGLRAAVYSGNDRGMPHWGNAGLPARDIDAVARYIMLGLRAE